MCCTVVTSDVTTHQLTIPFMIFEIVITINRIYLEKCTSLQKHCTSLSLAKSKTGLVLHGYTTVNILNNKIILKYINWREFISLQKHCWSQWKNFFPRSVCHSGTYCTRGCSHMVWPMISWDTAYSLMRNTVFISIDTNCHRFVSSF